MVFADVGVGRGRIVEDTANTGAAHASENKNVLPLTMHGFQFALLEEDNNPLGFFSYRSSPGRM